MPAEVKRDSFGLFIAVTIGSPANALSGALIYCPRQPGYENKNTIFNRIQTLQKNRSGSVFDEISHEHYDLILTITRSIVPRS